MNIDINRVNGLKDIAEESRDEEINKLKRSLIRETTSEAASGLEQQQQEQSLQQQEGDEVLIKDDRRNMKDISIIIRDKVRNEIIKQKLKKDNMFIKLFSPTKNRKSQSKVMRRWRVAYIVALFISMLRNAYFKIKIYGAVRSEHQLNDVQKQHEEQQIVQLKRFVFYPNSSFKRLWDIFMAFVLVIVVIIAPYRVSFSSPEDQGQIITFYIIDITFLMDIIFTFFCAYSDNKNAVVDNHLQIALNYIKGLFLIDVLSIFPFNLVFASYFNSANNQTASNSESIQFILRLLRFPKMYRLLQLIKISKTNKSLDRYIALNRFLQFFKINEGLIEIIGLLMKILYLNHLIACIWHYTSKINNYEGDCWVAKYQYKYLSNSDKYVAALYWSIQTLTTVGYGDIAPNTELEMVFAMIWMFFGVGFLSYTMGNLSSIISGLSKQTDNFNNKINTFSDFSLKINLPIKVKKKVLNFYLDNFFKNMYHEIDPHLEIQQLPQQIKNELLLTCFEYMKDEISLFRIDDNFTADIVQHLKLLVRNKGDIIYRAGDYPDSVYFLGNGKIQLQKDNGTSFVLINEGSFFGEMEIMDQQKSRLLFAVAEEKCQLYFCSAEVFLQSMREFQLVEQEVLEIIRRRKQKYKLCSMLILDKSLSLVKGDYKKAEHSKQHQGQQRNEEYYLNLLAHHQRHLMMKRKKIGFKFWCRQKENFKIQDLNKAKQKQKELEEIKDKFVPSFSFQKRNKNILDKTIKKFQTFSSFKSKAPQLQTSSSKNDMKTYD